MPDPELKSPADFPDPTGVDVVLDREIVHIHDILRNSEYPETGVTNVESGPSGHAVATRGWRSVGSDDPADGGPSFH